MKKNVSDTIFSLATLPGRSGVAVIRVSGPQAIEIARQITGRDHFKPRHTSLSTFMSCDGGAIDEGLLIFMPGPSSFTGEDCVEFQIHGSLAVIEGMSVALHGLGARQAEAGEFTRRAFVQRGERVRQGLEIAIHHALTNNLSVFLRMGILF